MHGNHKRLLRKNIIFILCLLIAALFMVLIYGYVTLESYRRQAENNVNTVIDFYTESVNADFEKINNQVLTLMLGNSLITEQLPQKSKPKNTLEKTELLNIQNELNKQLYDLMLNYDKRYNLWYYNSDMDIFCESGNGDYNLRKSFKEFAVSRYLEEEPPLTQKQCWFLADFGNDIVAVTAYHTGDNFMGCWIDIKVLVEPLYALEYVGRDGVAIINNTSEPEALYPDDPARNRRLQEGTGIDNIIEAVNLKYADFSICIVGENHIQNQVYMYQFIMLLLVVIIAIVVLWLIGFTRRSVIRPLQFFSENLQKFKDTGSFNMDTSYEEFEDAGRLLKGLEEEIKQLKISVYEERLNKQKVELDYAQLQIRPHFYINCMNNIYSLAQMKRYYEIEDLAIYVSNYLRSIFRKGMVPVSLAEEFESITNYLEIHKILYHNGLDYDVYGTGDAMRFMVPPLLIQVFVENCVKHTAGHSDEVLITVRARVDEECDSGLRIHIEDSGDGFPQEVLDNAGNLTDDNGDSRFHIGLKNVVARLHLLYGSRAGVFLSNGVNGGACVDIFIPAAVEDEHEYITG